MSVEGLQFVKHPAAKHENNLVGEGPGNSHQPRGASLSPWVRCNHSVLELEEKKPYLIQVPSIICHIYL